MSVKVENVEKNKVALEITVDVKEFEQAINRAAKKVAGQVNIPGFRKGKAPRHIIERHLGKDYIINEAIDPMLGPAYAKAVEESGIAPVSKPEVDLVQAEEGKDFIFKVIVDVKPEVELGQYLGLKVEPQKAEVTDEKVDEELVRRQETHAKLNTVEEGKVENKDSVTIDFEGFVDGVAFAGGKGEDHELVIGSGTFIPGFEDQLIGSSIGEEVTVKVRFPDEYHSAELSGKDAEFKVAVKGIKRKELVPLDDEFAKDISEFDTLEELKADIKEKMIEATELRLKNEFRAQVVNQAVNHASVEIPESMVASKLDSIVEEMARNLSYQGLTMEQYAKYLNMNEDQLKESYRPQAVEGIKTELVLETISKKEGITVSDEEMQAEMTRLSEQYGRKVEELQTMLAARGELDWFKLGMISDKTIDFLVANNDFQEGSAGQKQEANEVNGE
ncbi:Trigger factor [Syntrophobotulus glycolicus DSM 8271]|uniref:Trigger factor n=1 Tax=Syntrophobotulus glycolicus (strain DSM 8271 / FlGlyR) TaxID=645991 RepID=F0SVZ2_SYNGF|nr:trigger factor [Syntrophobotulus glycolicus]ADY56776.1 Trigger factor [Syntrophobotulus glycolicus DSM 8271]